MTRVGMKEADMEAIARFIFECIREGKEVRTEVNRFRSGFVQVKYSFDELLADLKSPNNL
jgi:glycine/serine hydroxymethyltransferase